MTPLQTVIASAFNANEPTTIPAIAGHLCGQRWGVSDLDHLTGVVQTAINEMVDANIVHAVSVCPSLFVLVSSEHDRPRGRRKA